MANPNQNFPVCQISKLYFKMFSNLMNSNVKYNIPLSTAIVIFGVSYVSNWKL